MSHPQRLPNITYQGINTLLSRVTFEPSDELLSPSQYGAQLSNIRLSIADQVGDVSRARQCHHLWADLRPALQ